MTPADWPPLPGLGPEEALAMWTLYDHPLDYPDFWVVRRCFATRGSSAEAVPVFDVVPRLANSLAEARALVPYGLYRFPRQEGDDAFIVETWF